MKKEADIQIDDVIKDLNKLGDITTKRMLSRNARLGAKYLLEKVKRLTKAVTGAAREQWVIKRKLIKGESTVYFNIQAKPTKGSGKAPHARFQDSGTKNIKPNLIRSKAFDLNANQAFKLVDNKIEKAINRKFKKLGWKRSSKL